MSTTTTTPKIPAAVLQAQVADVGRQVDAAEQRVHAAHAAYHSDLTTEARDACRAAEQDLADLNDELMDLYCQWEAAEEAEMDDCDHPADARGVLAPASRADACSVCTRCGLTLATVTDVHNAGPVLRSAIAMCLAFGDDPDTMTTVGVVALNSDERTALPGLVAVARNVPALTEAAIADARRAVAAKLATDLGPEA